MLVAARIRRRLRRRRRRTPADKPRQPVVGKGGDDEEAAQGLGFPGFATKNTTRVGGADAVADAAGVAQAIYPARSRDTRPAAVTLVDGKDWRAAISAAQLMSRPLRAPILLSDGDKLPDATQSALDDLGPTGADEGRQRAGHPHRQDGRAGRAAEHRRRGRATRPSSPRRSTSCTPPPPARPARVGRRRASSAPEFAMPAAAWAAKAGDPRPVVRPRPRPAPPPRPRSPPTAARASTCSGRRR